MRVINLSQNIKQTDSFEKVRDNLLQTRRIIISGINWHFPAKLVLVKVYVYSWDNQFSLPGVYWRRWGRSPYPLRAELCGAGDSQWLEPGQAGMIPSGDAGTHAPACGLLRAACTCPPGLGTPKQECKLHICLGSPWRSRWPCVTLEEQKCFLKWPNKPFVVGWRKKIKQAFRHMVTVLWRRYWNF